MCPDTAFLLGYLIGSISVGVLAPAVDRRRLRKKRELVAREIEESVFRAGCYISAQEVAGWGTEKPGVLGGEPGISAPEAS